MASQTRAADLSYRFLELDDGSPIPTPGEILHASVDFKALRAEYDSLKHPDEKNALLTRKLPSAAILGQMCADDETIARFRAANRQLLDLCKKVPGLNLRLAYQSLNNFNTVPEGWQRSSPLLTPSHLRTALETRVTSGATAYYLLQNRYTSTGSCLESHVPLVVVPKNRFDGPAFFIEVKWNKLKLPQVDQQIADRYRNNVNFPYREIREPAGPFETIQAGTQLDPNLGLQDEVVVGMLHPKGGMLAEVAPIATGFERGGGELMLPTQGIIEIDFDEETHQRVRGGKEVVQAGNELGTVVTNTVHHYSSSCVHTVHRLAYDGTEAELAPNMPLHEVLFDLCRRATHCYWTDNKTIDFYAFLEKPTVVSEVSAKDMVEKITEMLNCETMKTGRKGAPAFNTIYCMGNRRHPDDDADYLYKEASKNALQMLENKVREIREGY
ncbi:MAG: hypothetical protein EOR16_32330 [Mesorhizobium sp.]|uniref:hypothetical protein n=1 Tax=Mesorhizobium sp. TaxID=1871066 RepID=UPI000FE809FE|nr:hypothetical protein [Mesorhizobium sp.]RWI48936.1 MAG: hypothetical protein EOR16_32330 [Mesorhizobium sp.]